MTKQLYLKCTFEGCAHRPFSYFTINEHMAYHVMKKFGTIQHFNLRCTQCDAFFMGNVHAEDHAKSKKHLVVANAATIVTKSNGTRQWVEMMKKFVRLPTEEEMIYTENQVHDRGRMPGTGGCTARFFERERTRGMDRRRTPANDRGRTAASERRRSPSRGRTPGLDRGRIPPADRGRSPGGTSSPFRRSRAPSRSPANVQRVYRPSSPEILLHDEDENDGYSPRTIRSFMSSRSVTPRSVTPRRSPSPRRNDGYKYGSFRAFGHVTMSGENREHEAKRATRERAERESYSNDHHNFNGTDAGRQVFRGSRSYDNRELRPIDSDGNASYPIGTTNLEGLHQQQSTPQTTSSGHVMEKNGETDRNTHDNEFPAPSDRRAIRSGAPPGFSPQKKFASAVPHPYSTPSLLPHQENMKMTSNTVMPEERDMETIFLNQDSVSISPEAQRFSDVEIIVSDQATTLRKSQKISTKGGKSKKRRTENGLAPYLYDDDGKLSPLEIIPHFKPSNDKSEKKAKKDKKKHLRKRTIELSDSEEENGKNKKKKKKHHRSRSRSRRRRSSSHSSLRDSRSPPRHRRRSRSRSGRRSRDSSVDSRSHRRSRHSSRRRDSRRSPGEAPLWPHLQRGHGVINSSHHEKRRSRSRDRSFSRTPRTN